jgi:hypothetical protein
VGTGFPSDHAAAEAVMASGDKTGYLPLMAEETRTVTIKEGSQERVVKVIIEGRSLVGLDFQALAQEAWFLPGRMLRKDGLTVMVAKSKR